MYSTAYATVTSPTWNARHGLYRNDSMCPLPIEKGEPPHPKRLTHSKSAGTAQSCTNWLRSAKSAGPQQPVHNSAQCPHSASSVSPESQHMQRFPSPSTPITFSQTTNSPKPFSHPCPLHSNQKVASMDFGLTTQQLAPSAPCPAAQPLSIRAEQALKSLQEILTDPYVPASVRLRAALAVMQVLLESSARRPRPAPPQSTAQKCTMGSFFQIPITRGLALRNRTCRPHYETNLDLNNYICNH
jgi:hypothetical protein